MFSSSFFYSPSIFNLTFVFLVLLLGSSLAQLSTDFYSKTCPALLDTVKPVVESAVSKEKRMGASLLRLHFHDCFVNGCDGSILLDDTPSFTGEKNAGPNRMSVRGYDVIDDIKLKVEEICPGVVSCADIVAIAARDSVVLLGGPNWDVKLGRRDSKTASVKDAETGLVSPASTLSAIISRYHAVGLSTTDVVALSGGHTIGQAKCSSFEYRIYNDPNIDPSFAKTRQESCPSTNSSGYVESLAPLDLQTPTLFDNSYFKNLINQKGLLHSDQELYNGGSTDFLVEKYSEDPSTFNSDFAAAMVRMGDISPLTGPMGEIRKNCRKAN